MEILQEKLMSELQKCGVSTNVVIKGLNIVVNMETNVNDTENANDIMTMLGIEITNIATEIGKGKITRYRAEKTVEIANAHTINEEL